MTDQSARTTSAPSHWLRALIMLLFFIAARLVTLLVGVLAIVQFCFVLSSYKPNGNLLRFGKSLGAYLLEITEFLTYNSESRPWPFSSWPISHVEPETGREAI